MGKDRLFRKESAHKKQKTSRTINIRMIVVLLLGTVVLFVPLYLMLYYDMITEHDRYEGEATENQTRSTSVSASRGTIYDRNMNILAISSTAENVFLDPNEIATKNQNLGVIASGLADILDVDADWIRKQAEDTTMRYKVIARKIDSDHSEQVRAFINENDLSGIHLEPDSKRYYPNTSLASQVLGFVNTDNTGTEGIEAKYDSYLEGTAGKIITTKGNNGAEMLYQYEKYYEASDGDSIVLTLDSTAQYYLEKNMQAAIDQYDVQNGAFGILMDVNSGEVLAMATLGGFDPNTYLSIYDEPTDQALEQLYATAMSYPKGSEAYQSAIDEYNSGVAAARLSQWRNRCVSDGYEPGSTFKLITLASALEEGAITLDSTFYCGGATNDIKGRTEPLNCWKPAGHGTETTAQALQNSCNIAFARIGIALGGDKLYDYIDAFGLMEKTGIDLPGESSGLFFSRGVLADQKSDASLCSVSFGQTFKITPVQLVRAVSAVVNGGYLLEPYAVSEILDENGSPIQKNERTVLRQVISEDTSKTMRTLMESVVTEGTAKNARVAGYRIGGKTGTSEKIDEYDENGVLVEDKIVSFIGVAPIDAPKYVCLVALDTPSTATGIYISGGVMAAPTVRDVMADVLPYLGVDPEYSGEDAALVDVTVPYLIGMTEAEAADALKQVNLQYRVVGDGETVTDQIAASGSQIPGESTVVLYMGGEKQTDLVTVPNIMGMSIENANRAITNAGLYIKLKGATDASSTVVATDQSTQGGLQVARGTVITVEFTDYSAQD
ncbi:MAG: penicillin-binding transpeptidase domain-containing protein [Oscillospiraceae bacterium]|nr:penicillin-binding transpeptidase domain-containing protein [Oscillospiraceae bacterium]